MGIAAEKEEFQFTPPRGGGRPKGAMLDIGKSKQFQFTPPRGGATANLHKNKLLYICKMAK